MSEAIAEHTHDLAHSENRFRAIIEHIADAVVVVDRTGVVRYANRTASVLFGKRHEELVGASFGFPVVAGDTTEVDLFVRGAPRVAEMRSVESEWEGQPASIASLRDVTDRKRAEQDARRLFEETAARKAAEQVAAEALSANRTKADFLAVVSHDLRTPLSAIVGFAGLLEDGIPDPLTDESQMHVERIQRAAKHLLYLLNELLAFARLDAGREELHLRDVDVREIARDVGIMCEPMAVERQLRFSLVLPPEPVRLRTDPDKVRQVLLNLVSNAVKYTTTGEVTLSLCPSGDEGAVMSVQDTGDGIDEANRERIFEPFWQVDASQRARDGGTGLGLSIVRRLVELLGGSVAVESTIGSGSTFLVTLPRSANA